MELASLAELIEVLSIDDKFFTPSLTTSAVSRYLGLFFHDFEHTSQVSAPALVPFEGVTILRR